MHGRPGRQHHRRHLRHHLGLRRRRANQKWIYTPSTQSLRTAGLCLDAGGGGSSAGTPVILWTCTGASTQR
ncbi:ricin-type beta-trefoil lectin domain protein [Streptomyces sp. NPDC051976]|uniref:ricin-type beta-trefoil lectin domain protein n=1 Tax=Streptomyces sp. NPDC051976 TaxID=3154947 RepID=UPI003440F90F